MSRSRSDSRDFIAFTKSLSMAAVIALVAIASSSCSERDPMSEIRSLQSAGRFEESLDPLRELLVSDPNSPEINYRYGLAIARSGNPGMAVWALRRAQEDPEWASQAGIELARTAFVSQNWTNAIQAASRVLESDRENVEALEIRAESYLGQMTKNELAFDDLDRAIELAPERMSLRISRVRALILTGQIEEAATAMVELESLYASSGAGDERLLATICALRVTFTKERGELEEAVGALEGCLELNPADNTLVETAIELFDARGEPDRANVVIRAALEEKPKSLYFRTTLATRVRALEGATQAEEILRAGLGLGSDLLDEAIWSALAQHYAELDDPEQAAEAYGRAIALSPEVSEIGWLTYADLLINAGRGDEALEAAGHLKQKHNRLLIEARLQLEQGDPERAVALFDEVLVFWPDNAGAHYFAARAAEQIGDFEGAIEEYRQSIRADATATDAGWRYANLLLALGDTAGAWVASGYHVRAQPQDRAGRLLRVRLALRRGGPTLRTQLEATAQTPLFPEVVAMVLDSVAEREGPARAVERLGAFSLDTTRPRNAPVLRASIRHLIEAGDTASAHQAISAALEAHPDEAAFHSIAGLEQNLTQQTVGAGRKEYERALELNPNERFALEAMGRIALAEGEVSRAIEAFDRAARAAPEDVDLEIRNARLLMESASIASGDRDDSVGKARRQQIEDRWQRIAREFSWEPEPLQQLSEQALGRSDSETALALALRAVRLGGGREAWELLAQIHEARGESEKARKARARTVPSEEPSTS